MDGTDEIGHKIPENLHKLMPTLPLGWGWFVFCPSCRVFEALTEDTTVAARFAAEGCPLLPVTYCMN